jgi:hypothetical protein
MEQIKDIIEKVKASGNVVMKITLGGEIYVYRSIKRLEWRKFQSEVADQAAKNPDESAAIKDKSEDNLVKLAILWPLNIEPSKLRAGIPSQLADLILKASGFGTEEPEPEML